MSGAAEIDEKAVALDLLGKEIKENPIAVVFGNEVVGVEKETLERVDKIIFIPMQ